MQFNNLLVLPQLSHPSKWPNTCTDAQAKYNMCVCVGGGGEAGRDIHICLSQLTAAHIHSTGEMRKLKSRRGSEV